MSFNRTTYDNCSYKQELQNNVSTLSYLLSPYRYEHENKCRHQLGFVGGTVVSHIQGNLVDLDSELRGQTRIISKCNIVVSIGCVLSFFIIPSFVGTY